jgi:hypothetical protein
VGIPLGGQPVKHRQLARQVGERVEDPPASSMASFKFSTSVPSQGTTFVFGSLVCIADGVGDFRRFLIDMKPKTSAADPRSDLDKFIDNLDGLSTHASATKIEMESAPGSTSSSVAATFLGLDSFQSKDSRNRSRLGSCNPATDLQEANVSGSLSMLKKDLDSLLQVGRPEATACRGASGYFGASDLMITSMPEGCIVHWRGMALSDLLEAEGRLVAHLEPLTFQEGRPLATVVEGLTELVIASSDELTSSQVLMAEEGEEGYPIVDFEVVSEDEATANTGKENDADREARRARNRVRAIRRRRANERRRSMYRELDPEFVVVSKQGFRTPVANIGRVTAILERSHDPDVRQALLYTQRAWIQLDQQSPASTIREEHVGESRSQAHSRTAGGRPRHQPSHNNNNARGSEVPVWRQQPPLGGNP